ncbi:MAG: phosphoribosylanthranilate isomerase [Acidimicrobiia bacterium]|nr:phosphoribosylanthranilate isomerase [Acidimicrobiia bacterium]
MTWVKICGITSREALDAAHEAGADAVGFVIAPRSPRAQPLEAIADMVAHASLPSYLVSVDASPDDLADAVHQTGATGIQPHGAHAVAAARRALDSSWEVLLPVPMGPSGAARNPHEVPTGAIPLLDTASPSHGGTGTVFRWELIDRRFAPFVLAGGLGVDNVRRAIAEVAPFGVDASSRLETAPGVKDPDTIRAFIEEAKSA